MIWAKPLKRTCNCNIVSMKLRSFIDSLKRHFTISNLWNGFFAVAILMIVINPSAKALMIQGLMKLGLFQPDISPMIKADDSKALPRISFQSPKGQTIYLQNLKGKVIFMNFWATWCPPCIAEMPSINQLYEKLKNNKNVVFIIVDADHDFSKSIPFMTKHHYSLPLYMADDLIPENLLGSAIPATVIFDRHGKIVFRHEGGADYSNANVQSFLTKLSM